MALLDVIISSMEGSHNKFFYEYCVVDLHIFTKPSANSQDQYAHSKLCVVLRKIFDIITCTLLHIKVVQRP